MNIRISIHSFRQKAYLIAFVMDTFCCPSKRNSFFKVHVKWNTNFIIYSWKIWFSDIKTSYADLFLGQWKFYPGCYDVWLRGALNLEWPFRQRFLYSCAELLLLWAKNFYTTWRLHSTLKFFVICIMRIFTMKIEKFQLRVNNSMCAGAF